MKATAVAAFAISCALTACGGDGEITETVTVDQPQENTTLETGDETVAAEESEVVVCEELIASNETGLCEGDRGATYEVVYLDQVLEMDTQEVAVSSITTQDEVGQGNGSFSTRANGTYVIVELAVTNLMSAPRDFDPFAENVYLTVEGDSYSQDFDAANNPGTNSFVWQSDGGIQPNETQTGTVIFDVPDQIAANVLRDDTDSAVLLGELNRPNRPPFGGIVLREQGKPGD